MKRLFKGKGFYLAVFLQLFGYMFYFERFGLQWSNIKMMFFDVELLHIFTQARNFGIVPVLLPMIAVLPASGMIAEDRQSGLMKMILHRSSKLRYSSALLMRAAIGAFLASLIGSLCFIGLMAILGNPPGERTHSIYEMLLTSSYQGVADAHGLHYMADSILRTAYAALCWALVGVGISSVCGNAGLSLVLTTALCLQVSNALYYGGDVLMHWSQRSIISAWISYVTSLYDLTIRQTFYLIGGLLIGVSGLWWGLLQEQGGVA